MRDRDVRRVLLNRLAATYAADEDALLLEELGLCGGSVRADIAVVNGSLKGYEIKSDRDTLTRLREQASIYSQVFDTVTLVVAARHLSAAESMIPPWWGIEAVSNDSTAVKLETVREEVSNPSVDCVSLAKLLWRDEILSILDRLNGPKALRRRPRRVLWEHLATALSLTDLKDAVRQSLKNRTGWQVVVPRTLNGERFLLSSRLSSSPVPRSRERNVQCSCHPS